VTTTADDIDREEQRTRARAARHGLRLRKSRRDGSYILSDMMGCLVAGETRAPGWTLAEIADWLDADEGGGGLERRAAVAS
jgi:hypothetical protein